MFGRSEPGMKKSSRSCSKNCQLSALCHVTLVPVYAYTFKALLPVLQEAGSGSRSVEHMVSERALQTFDV